MQSYFQLRPDEVPQVGIKFNWLEEDKMQDWSRSSGGRSQFSEAATWESEFCLAMQARQDSASSFNSWTNLCVTNGKNKFLSEKIALFSGSKRARFVQRR